MIMPDVLIVENYRTMAALGLVDTILGIGAALSRQSAFGIFLLRQTFKTVPQRARRRRARGRLQLAAGAVARSMCRWRGRPTSPTALVSVSYHWNNFLWPLVITNSVTTRPLTVGLPSSPRTDQGIDWSIITAATLMIAAPLLVAFLLFQRQFVQSFMRAGIK